MSADEPTQRHSEAGQPTEVADPDEYARVEARNGLRQFDYVVRTVRRMVSSPDTFRLRPSLILELNRLATD